MTKTVNDLMNAWKNKQVSATRVFEILEDNNLHEAAEAMYLCKHKQITPEEMLLRIAKYKNEQIWD